MEQPPPPFALGVRPGPVGEAWMTGKDWYLHREAYTARFPNAFDRFSLFAAPTTRAYAIRITQPAGYGAPLHGHNIIVKK